MRTNPQLISIVIPVMSGADTIGRLIDRLRSLRKPSGMDLEIIAGYTPSRDNTLEILQEKGVTIAHSEPRGPGTARNAAVKVSTGAYLYFIDADAWPLHEDFLVRVMRIWQSLGTFGCFGGPILLDTRQRGNPVAVADHFACWFNWTAERASCQSSLPQPTVSLAITRTLFDRLGGFDPSLCVLEDFEFQQRILERGLPINFCADIPVCHRARGTPWASWRHSWRWGLPYREVYLRYAQNQKWRFIDDRRLFWLNLPRMFLRRVRLVLRGSWRVSKWQTLYCFPFLLATIFAWALAVVVGEKHPPARKPSTT